MDKVRKQNIKRMVAIGCIVAVVILLAVMPLIAKQDKEEDGPVASILSDTVKSGSINTELIGGGILSEEDADSITVPAAVKLKSFLVNNGDFVTEGAAIAAVDRVSVMNAISQVQKTLEYLSEQIAKAGEEDSDETVTALAGGTVKILYAEKGESVQSIMLEHGALAVLSLDGLMAVDFETESQLSPGTEVKVTLSGGETVDGKIVKNLAGEITVTVDDDDYPVDQQVEVTTEDGTNLGSGALYIYSPWNATAYTGTVKNVKVSVGDKLRAGKTILTLSDVGYSATYRQLIGQRQEYEDMMFRLFQMYQTQTVTAPCDGVVSGIDENSVQLLSAKGNGYSIQFLANAPNGDDQTLYLNYTGKIREVAENGWVVDVNPQPIPIADYMDMTGVNLDETLMTQAVLHTQTEIPVFTLTDGVWTQVDRTTIGAGDVLLFASDMEGNLVWSVLVQKQLQQPEDTDDIPQPDTSTDNTTPTVPDTQTTPSMPSGNDSYGSDFFGGNYFSGGTMEQKPEFELYDLGTTQIAAVTPQKTMTLDITIDELDIKDLQIGMTAQVKIDALGGEKHQATITQIGNSGTNNGGNSKYIVELTMDRSGNMLSGMNATATIVLSAASDILTIPADALVERGNQTVVYTDYDDRKESLCNPVTVKVGKSDGETVEILEGLTEGQTYYYEYYDTLEISDTPDFGGFGFVGR